MKTKFTPGPWRYDRDNLNVYSNGMVAQTFGHTHNGEREANACLLAAAPEMFHLLRHLLDENTPVELHAIRLQARDLIQRIESGGK